MFNFYYDVAEFEFLKLDCPEYCRLSDLRFVLQFNREANLHGLRLSEIRRSTAWLNERVLLKAQRIHINVESIGECRRSILK